MKIRLIPIQSTTEARTIVNVAEQTISVNSTPYDFTALEVGGDVEPGLPFIGKVTRPVDVVEATIRFFPGPGVLPDLSVNPLDWTFELTDGAVAPDTGQIPDPPLSEDALPPPTDEDDENVAEVFDPHLLDMGEDHPDVGDEE